MGTKLNRMRREINLLVTFAVAGGMNAMSAFDAALEGNVLLTLLCVVAGLVCAWKVLCFYKMFDAVESRADSAITFTDSDLPPELREKLTEWAKGRRG